MLNADGTRDTLISAIMVSGMRLFDGYSQPLSSIARSIHLPEDHGPTSRDFYEERRCGSGKRDVRYIDLSNRFCRVSIMHDSFPEHSALDLRYASHLNHD